MNEHFIAKLEELTALSQRVETSDEFTSQYELLLGQVMEQLRALRALLAIQMGFMQTISERSGGHA